MNPPASALKAAPKSAIIQESLRIAGRKVAGEELTKRTAAMLRESGYDVTEEYPFAGHDPNAWSMMLVKYLPLVLK